MVFLAVLLLPFDSPMSAGIAALKAYDDNGRNPNKEWRRRAGGTATCFRFECAAHENCGRRARVIRTGENLCVEINNDTHHSTQVSRYDRANASLSKEEKKELRTARTYGGTSGQVVSKLAAEAVAAGTAEKNSGDTAGLKGAPCLTICRNDERLMSASTVAGNGGRQWPQRGNGQSMVAMVKGWHFACMLTYFVRDVTYFDAFASHAPAESEHGSKARTCTHAFGRI